MAQTPPNPPDQFQHVGDLRGGQNSQDPPASLPDDQCVAAQNIEWGNGKNIVGQRRWGSVPLNVANTNFQISVDALHRYVPASNETLAELWGIDANEHINRLSQGFAAPFSNTFDSVSGSGIWTPHNLGFNPAFFLLVGDTVLIDGNVYQISLTNTSAFVTIQHNTTTYSSINVAKQAAVWSQPPLQPLVGIAGATNQTDWASLNNKLVIANAYGTDFQGFLRLHLWDPTSNATGAQGGVANTFPTGAFDTAAQGLVRRAGIQASLGMPLVADEGSGSYTATARAYRVRWIEERFIGNPVDTGPVPKQPVVLAADTGLNYLSGYPSGAAAAVTFTVNAPLPVVLFASAAGGGGTGSNTAFTSGVANSVVVGGGGAGATLGAGAGAQVVSSQNTFTTGTYVITVGAGSVYGVSASTPSSLIGPGVNLTANNGGDGGPDVLGNFGSGGTSGSNFPGGVGYGGFPQQGGGGAGAAGAGHNGGGTGGDTVANGGIGIASSISGASVQYAGGGGGGVVQGQSINLPGTGVYGGGNGSNTGVGSSAAPNSGAGAGGGPSGGGIGGSGIVIISFLTGSLSIASSTGTVTTNGANTVHTFLTSGTFVIGTSGNEGGAGGGGGASNTSGILYTLTPGNVYTLVVGQGGLGSTTGPAGAGGNTYFANSTANIFYFVGGNGASTVLLAGAGGSNAVGVGVVGGNGGVPSLTIGGVGTFNPAGTGGGGAGGFGSTSASYAGGDGGDAIGSGQPASGMVGGQGGQGGDVNFGLASQDSGGGGAGAGGNQILAGADGNDGYAVIAFSQQTFGGSLGGVSVTGTSKTFVAQGNFVPSQFLMPGQDVLVGGTDLYVINTVSTSAFTTTTNAIANYTSNTVAIQQSIVYRRSEPSPSITFTPSGGGAGVAVTQPTPPGDGETHWELESSTGGTIGVTFYRISTFPVGFVTANDAIDPATYTTIGTDAHGFVLSDGTGENNVPAQFKFTAGNQNRLLGFGSWNPNDPQNRLWFSDIPGDTGTSGNPIASPTETFNLLNYLDLNENDSGDVSGLVGPIFSVFFAFKTDSFYQIEPTGNVAQPFTANLASPTIGAVPHTIVSAVDESGNPTLYFWSKSGPQRYIVNPFGQGRLDYLGHNIENYLNGTTSRIVYSNVYDAPEIVDSLFYNHAEYYPDKRQVWFWMATNTQADGVSDQYTLFIFNIGRAGMNNVGGPSSDAYRSGWSVYTGVISQAGSSCMFSRTVGALMSHDLIPYVGISSGPQIYACDQRGVNTDNGVPYQAFVTTKAYTSGLMRNSNLNRAWGLFNAELNPVFYTPVFLQMTPDYTSALTYVATPVDLTPVTNETQKRLRFGDSGMGSFASIQFTIGDSGPNNVHWEILELIYELIPEAVQ